jgi:hypothetical protein
VAAALFGGLTIASLIGLIADSTDSDTWVGTLVLIGAVTAFAVFRLRHTLRKLKRLR